MVKNKSLRITQVMLSKGLGGGERIFIDICVSLAEKGHRIQAVCHPEFQGLSLLMCPNVQVYPLKVRWDYSISARLKLFFYLKSFKSQIVHTHMARASIIGGFSGRVAKIPAAANMHDYTKLKYYKNINHFFPGTEDLKEYLINNKISGEKIIVIPHFSRLSAVSTVSIDKDQPLEVISFGRFSPEKGFDVLIEAFKILKNRGLNLHLKLGGNGPDKQKLVNLVKKYELNNYVNFFGWVDNISDFFKKGSIFVLPSLREAFGIVVLEAMSQGKIIISSKAPGPSEILDNSMAYLFPVGNADALADCIQKAIQHPNKSIDRAKNALNCFNAYYCLDKVLPQFESSYHGILNKKELNNFQTSFN